MFLNAFSFFIAWYNLPFTVLILLCVLLASMQLIGLGGDDSGSHGDVDHGADLDHEVSLDHDVTLEHEVDLEHDISLDHEVSLDHDASLDHDLGHDLDHEADLGHDVEHGVDHEIGHEVDHGGMPALSLLAFIGVGKTPLMVVLLILFAAVGLIGWGLNSLVRSMLGVYPGPLLFAVLPAALIGGVLVSSRATRFLGRALPPISTTATRAHALVGQRATVISPFVDEKYGLVHVRDLGGTLISLFAVNPSGQPIRRGDTVVLAAYDPVRKVYTVEKT